MRRRSLGSVLLVLATVCSATVSLGTTGHAADPPQQESVQIAGQSVVLDPPTLSGQETADQQVQRIEPLLRGLPYRQFARDSVVAPVRIFTRYVNDSSGKHLGHQVHLLFVVHTPLTTFTADDFTSRLLGDSDDSAADSGPPGDVSPESLRSRGITDSGPNVRYQPFDVKLLDKIQLSGVLRITRHDADDQQRIDLRLDDRFDNRWTSLDANDQGGAYAGFQAWLTATALGDGQSVLIESRFVMHEPEQWFAGSNFLRSKLPLVLQEAARNLRRKSK
ncbi:hypothetical protein [Stieleria tagensis]|uniref:hypothetical protein n=1 Tax=Stieleria tagensis TaxID=2956795 RepID=UPI00209B344E|nr:hypothetical protein [Stieleria tagensis]